MRSAWRWCTSWGSTSRSRCSSGISSGPPCTANFGYSYRLAEPVATLFATRLPATLELSFTASVLAIVVGIPLGVYAGIWRKSWLSRSFMVGSLVGVSLPTFLIGILLILMLLGRARLAAELRPRHRGAARLVDHRIPHLVRHPRADPARHHARPVSR